MSFSINCRGGGGSRRKRRKFQLALVLIKKGTCAFEM
jgi:hypothetical protein